MDGFANVTGFTILASLWLVFAVAFLTRGIR
jgi:hypothetical protein